MKQLLVFAILFFSTNYIFAQSNYDLLIESGIEKDASDDFSGALKDYTNAISVEPENPKAYDLRAVTYIKSHKYSKAIKDISIALKYDPDYAPAYNHRGLANYYTNKSILALEDFNKAIELDPKFGQAYYNRGLVHLDFGDMDSAYSDFTKAKKLKYDRADDAIWKYCTDRMFIVPTDNSSEEENDSIQ